LVPGALEVLDCQVIPHYLLVPRVQGFLGCLEFLAYSNIHCTHSARLMALVELWVV